MVAYRPMFFHHKTPREVKVTSRYINSAQAVEQLQLALHSLTMNKLIIALLMCFWATALARYVAIPVEDVMDVEALERIRMPREVEAIGALRGPREASPTSSEPREYVDFGAHTGARGSYGWYVDYPVRKTE